jgi:hypothetical protein
MAKGSLVCTQCGTVGDIARSTKGSFLIELILWLCFLIPGLIYSVWRLTTRAKVCRCCGSSTLVPVDSPVGRKLARQTRASTFLLDPSKTTVHISVPAGGGVSYCGQQFYQGSVVKESTLPFCQKCVSARSA